MKKLNKIIDKAVIIAKNRFLYDKILNKDWDSLLGYHVKGKEKEREDAIEKLQASLKIFQKYQKTDKENKI